MAIDSQNKRRTASALPFLSTAQENQPEGFFSVDARAAATGSTYAMGSWTSPTSFGDPQTEWTDEANAYDEGYAVAPATFAIESNFDTWGWIELNFSSAILTEKFRIYASFVDEEAAELDPLIIVGFYCNDNWVSIYLGESAYGGIPIEKSVWHEIVSNTHPLKITKARIGSGKGLLSRKLKVFEFQCFDISGFYPYSTRAKVYGNLCQSALIGGGLVK